MLAGLSRLSLRAIAVFGIAIIALHNAAGAIIQPYGQSIAGSGFGRLAQVLYFGGDIGSGPTLVVLYSIIPWVGVMAAGYAFGAVVRFGDEERRRWCYRIGGVAILIFLLLRGFNVYGDQRPWGGSESQLPALLSFLNTSKYPASLLFLLMTLGPTIALVPLLERARGWVADVLYLFGRVPLFYYLLHIPLIHGVAVLVAQIRDSSALPWLFANHPMWPPEVPEGYTWSLALLYGVTLVVVTVLYFPCRWFAEVKRRRREGWLSLL